MKKDNKKRASDLRKKAEKRFKPETIDIKKLSEAEVRKLAQELQSHQIKLEMQNEELRKSQLELEDSKDRYSTLYDLVPIGCFTISEGGIILEVNLKGATILGRERGSLIKKPLSNFIARVDQDKYYLCRRHVFAMKEYKTCKLQMIKNDGAKFSAQLEFAVSLDLDGNFRKCMITITDITEKERVENKLHKLSYAVEQSPVTVVITDKLGKIEYVNQKFLQLTGYTPEESIGKNPRILQSGKTPPEIYKELWKNIESGKKWQGEFCNKKKNGELYWESAVISPVKDAEGITTQYIAVKEDITRYKQTRKKLEESDAKLRSILSSLYECAIMVCDRDGKITTLWGTPEMDKRYGIRAVDVVGKSIKEFISPEYLDQRLADIHRVFDSGEKMLVEYVAIVPGGDFCHEASLSPMKDVDGNILAVVWFIRDITERKRVDHELKVRNLQQTNIAYLGRKALVGLNSTTLMNEAVKIVARTLDNEFCKVLELLPDGKNLLLRAGIGWKEGLVGKATVSSGQDSQAGYTLQMGEPVIVDDLRTEKRFSGTLLLYGHGAVSGISVIIHGHKGSWGVLGTHTTRHKVFSKDDVNFVQSVANILSDAFINAQAEEELGKLYCAIEQSPNMVFITNSKGIIEYVNPGFTKVTGYSPDEVIGKNQRVLKPENITQEEFTALWKTLLTGKEWHGECYNKKKNGDLYWEYVTISPIKVKNSSEVNHFVSIKTDITEEKLKDQFLILRERQATMGEMLSIIAHQWRQPLTTINVIAGRIKNLLELNRMEKDDTIDSLALIQKSILSLSQTIDDFRSIYKQNKPKALILIEDEFQNCITIIGNTLKMNKICIKTSFRSGRKIKAYPNEFMHVFLNIIKNTEDIAKERHLKNVTITLEEYEKDGFIIIDISDNAGGIPDDSIGKIFLPYFSTKEEKQGAGLGLYICKMIIEKHSDGEITARNGKDGALFTIKLPVAGEFVQ
ncbi:MAG: PAS domain S-box protein [Candidatus Brocadiaceae bacterium]|nr:PAS domain S-box protein [Candidatus Brocadiaceae bacterium]